MRVPFVGIDAEYEALTDSCMARLRAVIDSRTFVLGEQTLELETAMTRITESRHAVACSSGSDALFLALQSCGIGRGDAVLVPAFSFFATAGAVERAGADPVFVDIDEETFNAGAAQFRSTIEKEFVLDGGSPVHRRLGSRLKGLIAVHLYGRAAGMADIVDLASAHGLVIIEDAAQAIGASADTGRVGSAGSAGCFSYYPTKNIGGAGDGGAITTSDDEMAASLRRLRTHGADGGAYEHRECGINARMGELQAAVLNTKLPHLEEWTLSRVEIAARYRRLLETTGDVGLRLPTEAPEGSHVFHQFVVRVAAERRDAVQAAMAERGVDTRVFYPLPLHLQPCFARLGYSAGHFPVSEAASREVLALPIYPSLAPEAVEYVCASLCDCLGA